jgi:hypothetical protein
MPSHARWFADEVGKNVAGTLEFTMAVLSRYGATALSCFDKLSMRIPILPSP